MTELFDRRKTELEVAGKNTIVEIYLFKEKIDEMNIIMESKEKYLSGVNAALREIEYLEGKMKELDEQD
jgi:hypothetical protein